jgi:hypothetical protein
MRKFSCRGHRQGAYRLVTRCSLALGLYERGALSRQDDLKKIGVTEQVWCRNGKCM